MCFPRKTLCSTYKRCKWGYLLFHKERLEPWVLPWQQQSRCHFVSFVMYFPGAKFEEHCSNTSGDILDSVFYCLSVTIYDVITFLICIIQKREYLWNEKRYFKKNKCRYSLVLKAFQISGNYFLLHRHFRPLNKKCLHINIQLLFCQPSLFYFFKTSCFIFL